MKLKITKIELVEGSTINPNWLSEMYRVNDIYLASTIDQHNIMGQPFDLRVGETADVIIDRGSWIIRNN